MVDVSNGPESLYIIDGRMPNIIALEDGVMELFFDEGHIVFNSGVSVDSSLPTLAASTDLSIRTARLGGATHLLEVLVGQADEDRDLPTTVSYRFYRVSDRTILSRGSLKLEDMPQDRNYSTEELCKLFGRKTAENALSSW